MIVAGAGALFLAAWLGSHEQAYVYRAWQQTYLIMAAVMGVGVATALFTREPDSSRAATAARPAADNFRLLLLFACAVGAFVAAFIGFGRLLPQSGGVLAGFLLRIAASAAFGGGGRCGRHAGGEKRPGGQIAGGEHLGGAGGRLSAAMANPPCFCWH